jgi:multidrug efflux pump subunit AcrB
LRNQIPAGVHLASWYDQSSLIIASNLSARDAVVIGVGLAAFILLLFLRNWKITLFAAIAVPSVLCATVLLLYVFKMSFDIMTLGGLAAAVGLIIDDTIVMAEHIVRRVRERKAKAPQGVVLEAAAEFTRPLIGSSAATIIIFARHWHFSPGDWGVLQGVIAHDGSQPDYLLSDCLDSVASHFYPPSLGKRRSI